MNLEETMDPIEPRGSLRVIFIVLVMLAVIDFCILIWVVPWADEAYRSLSGSMGYVITFLTVFVNLLIGLALVAYYFKSQSYPSDRWQ